jgi:hypothetical protein
LDECVFWREGFCSSEEIELDSELGCLTLMEDGNPGEDDEEWDDEDLFDEDEWEEDL